MSTQSTQTIVLHVPDELYARIRRRAEESQRSVEAEFVNVLFEAVPPGDELPSEQAEVVAAFEQFDDDELWEVARARFPAEASNELQSLHDKQQRVGLTDAERERSDQLCAQFDRLVFKRARAASLLNERGHDVNRLLESA